MNTLDALMALGLNELEARIYIHLLSENPATGYRIAQAIGKPVANCYKALEMLIKKGAIEIDEGRKRLYTPSPPSEFLQRLRRQIQENISTAEKQLKQIKSIVNDPRIYQMNNPDQVFERSQAILRNARKIVVADIFPLALERLSESLIHAGARKIEMFVKCYQEISIKGVQVIPESRRGDIVAGYSGQWLKIVADARVHIIAFLSNDLKEVYQAVWSKSPLLSILHFNAIRSEMLLDRINEAARQEKNIVAVKSILKNYNARARELLPGYSDLIKISKKRSGGIK